MDTTSFKDRLAKELPKNSHFLLHHLSTSPVECPALFAAAPGQEPDKTFQENQFLSISIKHGDRRLQIFAIEVFIYTTHHLITIFVSKADSTGYLRLLELPKDHPSPLKSLATEFLQFLITDRSRSDRRLVLSLFARAQNQYLFPGSVENSYKHVLDDRALIKWWCQIVDCVLSKNITRVASKDSGSRVDATVSEGYLRVPGYDVYGTRTFLPKNSTDVNARWKIADPLRELAQSSDLPERCLIPRFPDDPKARYVETLDEELPIIETDDSETGLLECAGGVNAGRWRSIKSLDQFWEAMSFRQECSSGRLVGFLWALFQPRGSISGDKNSNKPIPADSKNSSPLPTPPDPQLQDADQNVHESGGSPILPLDYPQTLVPSSQTCLEPFTSTPIKEKQSNASALQPISTDHCYWPASSRGEIVLREREYNRVGRMLLRLDFSNLETAAESTDKWIKNVASKAGITEWGKTVIGERSVTPMAQQAVHGDNKPNVIGAGLVKKKKRPADLVANTDVNDVSAVNELAAGLLRKKPKTNGTITS